MSIMPLDETSGIDEVADALTCPEEDVCHSIIYVWSPAMPLSISGIDNARKASRKLKFRFHLLQAESSLTHQQQETEAGRRLARTIVAAGALIHFPSIAVLQSDQVLGHVIAGHKTATGYQRVFESRLGSEPLEIPMQATTRQSRTKQPMPVVLASFPGRVGAYFQVSTDRNWIAFEHKLSNYAISVSTGELKSLPGVVDPIFSSDDRLLVTTLAYRRGLEIHSIRSTASDLDHKHLFTDRQMVDQYPSVGVLDSDASSVRYRVLTSWHDQAHFREYRVDLNAESRAIRIRPVSPIVTACPTYQISLPVLSPDGQRLAARDERSGTTRLLDIDRNGHCTQSIELEIQTGKVSFSPDGGSIAFNIPGGSYRHGRGKIGWKTSPWEGAVYTANLRTMAVTKVWQNDAQSTVQFPVLTSPSSVVLLEGTHPNDAGTRFLSILVSNPESL